MSGIHKSVLGNGVRVLVEPVGHVRSAAVGLWCRTGSRNETDTEAGITHLIEHMLFKGTEKRTAQEIAESIEGRGGALNAFTDKENTCYYCRVLSDDVANGVEVLTDMMRHSRLDEEDLAKEEMVVCEEIKRSEDEPSDHVHELHLTGRWGSHPLGKPIIGTRESVTSFRRQNLAEYIDRRYRGDNILLSVAGNVDPAEVIRLAEETLGDLPSGGGENDVDRPHGKATTREEAKDVEQVHFCIGSDGVGLYDGDDMYTMTVLDTVLGGGMSARLFQEIREKRGLAYAIGSYRLSYGPGGAFTVYGGTSPQNWAEVQQLVRQELDRMMKEPVGDAELDKAKRSISGHLVLGLEGMNARMSRMARNELVYGREIPIEETLEKINSVDAGRIQGLAERLFSPELVSTTAIGPFA